jgi:hypothetical protein
MKDPTAGSYILLEMITQMLKMFLAFYGTERFTTLFTRACYYLRIFCTSPHIPDLEICNVEFKARNSSLSTYTYSISSLL